MSLEARDLADSRITRILEEIQTLGKLYGEQFNLVTQTIEGWKAKDLERHNQFLEEMQAAKTEREALADLLASLDASVASLQEVTVALINLSDQQQAPGASR